MCWFLARCTFGNSDISGSLRISATLVLPSNTADAAMKKRHVCSRASSCRSGTCHLRARPSHRSGRGVERLLESLRRLVVPSAGRAVVRAVQKRDKRKMH